jgi:hypothetical protein
VERYATLLPQVADALRRPVATLTEHTATPRPREVAAVSAVEHRYGDIELLDRNGIESYRTT